MDTGPGYSQAFPLEKRYCLALIYLLYTSQVLVIGNADSEWLGVRGKAIFFFLQVAFLVSNCHWCLIKISLVSLATRTWIPPIVIKQGIFMPDFKVSKPERKCVYFGSLALLSNTQARGGAVVIKVLVLLEREQLSDTVWLEAERRISTFPLPLSSFSAVQVINFSGLRVMDHSASPWSNDGRSGCYWSESEDAAFKGIILLIVQKSSEVMWKWWEYLFGTCLAACSQVRELDQMPLFSHVNMRRRYVLQFHPMGVMLATWFYKSRIDNVPQRSTGASGYRSP